MSHKIWLSNFYTLLNRMKSVIFNKQHSLIVNRRWLFRAIGLEYYPLCLCDSHNACSVRELLHVGHFVSAVLYCPRCKLFPNQTDYTPSNFKNVSNKMINTSTTGLLSALSDRRLLWGAVVCVGGSWEWENQRLFVLSDLVPPGDSGNPVSCCSFQRPGWWSFKGSR